MWVRISIHKGTQWINLSNASVIEYHNDGTSKFYYIYHAEARWTVSEPEAMAQVQQFLDEEE
jgi:hypothetical protein